MEREKGQPESAASGNASPEPTAQSRVWLNINFEELDQFTSPNIICQYCFRPIGLDKSIESLVADLRRKPLILSSTPLEPLWASEKSGAPSTFSTPDFGSRLPPTAYPPKLSQSNSSQKSTPRTPIEEDPLSQATANLFGAALPSTTQSLTPLDSSSTTKALRKDHITVMPPALTLQPRRPKARTKLISHEPHFWDPNAPPNGTAKRSAAIMPNPSQISSPLPSSGSQKMHLNETPASNIADSPGPTTQKVNKPASSSLFGLGGSMTEEDDAGENFTDEQLFRELVAHTVAEYDLELPLCCECAPSFYSNLQLQFEDADKEIEELENYLASFPVESRMSEEVMSLDGEMNVLQAQFSEIRSQFDDMVVEMALKQEVMEKYELWATELSSLKEDYWKRYYRNRHEDMCQQDVVGSVKARLGEKTKYLEMLRMSCGLNDAFNISFDGHYATMNGLRLGLRSPTLKSTVDWDEISAATGFLLFLFVKLGSALSHHWPTSKYRIRVDGSFSTIHYQKKGTIYGLFVDKESSWSLLRFRDQNSFDRAFEAFLCCFVEVTAGISTKIPDFTMPYPVKLDPISIAGNPLIPSRSNAEAWSHQVKQVIINVKSILKSLVVNGNVK